MSSLKQKGAVVLSSEQRRMYALEKLENFRWISKLVATYASYTLSDADLVPEDTCREITELGEFAELSYSSVDVSFLLNNITALSQPTFPLEGYHGLRDAVFVQNVCGTCADQTGYIAFRPQTKQLIVAVTGTRMAKQVLQDLRAIRMPHPSNRGTVHTGFWTLYSGLRDELIAGIRRGLEEHQVEELVVTGHSMGGSISYLLCLDLLTQDGLLPGAERPRLKLAVFGVPRTGDANLVDYFRQSVLSYRQSRGQGAFVEIAVKGYNDGVPALPPAKLGYRHFAQEPFYTEGGKLYRTPASESEHALFHIDCPEESQDEDAVNPFPRGGHNYYNGRDFERFFRRITWLDRANPSEERWEERYSTLVSKHQ